MMARLLRLIGPVLVISLALAVGYGLTSADQERNWADITKLRAQWDAERQGFAYSLLFEQRRTCAHIVANATLTPIVSSAMVETDRLGLDGAGLAARMQAAKLRMPVYIFGFAAPLDPASRQPLGLAAGDYLLAVGVLCVGTAPADGTGAALESDVLRVVVAVPPERPR